MRLVRVPLESSLGPLDALRTLREDDRPFALVGAWAGGGAVLGSEPVTVADQEADPFELLDELPDVEGDAAPGAVGGGWFGYLGYGLGARVERLPPPPPRRIALPPFSLAYYDHVLRLDADGQWWFEALSGGGVEHARLAVLRERMAGRAPAANTYRLGPFSAYPGRRGHSRAVEWCRRYIAAGDLYQANLCLRLEAGFEGDALDLFAPLRTSSRPTAPRTSAGRGAPSPACRRSCSCAARVRRCCRRRSREPPSSASRWSRPRRTARRT